MSERKRMKMRKKMLEDKLEALNQATLLTQDELMTVNNKLSSSALDNIIDNLSEAYEKLKGKTNDKKQIAK